MKLKKLVFTGTTAAILILPLIANADLKTINNTNEWSSVIITSVNPNRCSGSAGGITNPHSSLITTTTEVRALCKTTPCKATILMATDYNSAKNCNGSSIIIGTAILSDLNTDIVSSVDSSNSSAYAVSGAGTNQITLSYK